MDRRRFLALSVPALAAFAGCSDGDGTPASGGTATDTATPTDTATVTEQPTPMDTATRTDIDTQTGSPTPTETATPVQNPDKRVVVAPDGAFEFDPQSFTISAGETVLWEWDGTGHNVSPTEGEIPADSNWSGDDETTYASGHFHAHTFEATGSYSYHCDPHQSVGMTASFTVE